MCTCIFLISTYLFWWIAKLIKEDFTFAYSWRFSMLFSILWFALAAVWLFAFTIYYAVVPRRYNLEWTYSYIVHLSTPTMLLTAVTWVYWHYRFFNIPRRIQLMNKIVAENKRKLFKNFEENDISLT